MHNQTGIFPEIKKLFFNRLKRSHFCASSQGISGRGEVSHPALQHEFAGRFMVSLQANAHVFTTVIGLDSLL
jgi:hypothetical protein